MVQESPSLTPPQVVRLLQATATIVQAELAALPPGLASRHPQPGAWCVNEILGHFIGADRRGFCGRLRSMLDPTDPRHQSWERVWPERNEPDCGRDPAALLQEFLSLRAANIDLVAQLRPDDLWRSREDPRGVIRVTDLLHDWVHHDRDHVRQLLANVQAVWPHLGNAQRYDDR